MPAQTQQLYETVAYQLVDRLVSELGQYIDMIVLYGSVAKKQSHESSDIDILIVSSHKKRIYDKAAKIRSELDLEYETMTTMMFYTPAQFEESIAIGSPFLPEVLNEGIPLYGKAKFRSYQKAFQSSR